MGSSKRGRQEDGVKHITIFNALILKGAGILSEMASSAQPIIFSNNFIFIMWHPASSN